MRAIEGPFPLLATIELCRRIENVIHLIRLLLHDESNCCRDHGSRLVMRVIASPYLTMRTAGGAALPTQPCRGVWARFAEARPCEGRNRRLRPVELHLVEDGALPVGSWRYRPVSRPSLARRALGTARECRARTEAALSRRARDDGSGAAQDRRSRRIPRIHASAQRIDSGNTQAHPALITIPALARQHDFIVELAGRRPLRRGQAACGARGLRSSRGTIGQAPR